MDWHDGALIVAGVIGCGVAVVHGTILQRRIIEPLGLLLREGKGMPGSVGRLVPVLLQFSTFNWFVGGLALMVAAVWSGHDSRLAIGLLVGSSYLFGAIGNFWGTRGRHPGWVLYTIALGLIGLGLS